MAVITKLIGLPSGDVLAYSVVKDGFYLDADYDLDDLIRILNGPVVRSRYRIFVLFPDDTIDYEIPSSDIQAGGSYSENYQDGQRRSLSFTLYNDDGRYLPDINKIWAGTRLRLELGVELDDGAVLWFQKGVYIVKTVSPSQDASQKTLAISASDKYSLFDSKTGALETTYTAEPGSDIESMVKDTLMMDAGNGDPLDSLPISYYSSFQGKGTQATITHTAGETRASILSDLATQLSSELFYNAMGRLTFIPTTLTTLDIDKPLIYEYDADKGDIGSLSFSFNMDEIVNRVIVMGATSNGATFTATAVNNDPASPLCYQRIGYRTSSVSDSNITSTYLAQERAEYELRQQLVLKSSSSIAVPFNPLLEVNNVIALSDEYYGLAHERFLIQSISCSLDYSGTMSLSISNMRNLPFVSR